MWRDRDILPRYAEAGRDPSTSAPLCRIARGECCRTAFARAKSQPRRSLRRQCVRSEARREEQQAMRVLHARAQAVRIARTLLIATRRLPWRRLRNAQWCRRFQVTAAEYDTSLLHRADSPVFAGKQAHPLRVLLRET